MLSERQLPQDYVLIDKERHAQLEQTMFNPAADGLEKKNRFSARFNAEIGSVMKACSDYLATRGEFGSLDRYHKGMASDWWIGDDFFSVSRVLFIDLLDPRMQTRSVIEGLRDILHQIPFDWMLRVGHDNAYDNRGQFVERPGRYCFWIRKERVEVYSERPEDLETFYSSLA